MQNTANQQVFCLQYCNILIFLYASFVTLSVVKFVAKTIGVITCEAARLGLIRRWIIPKI